MTTVAIIELVAALALIGGGIYLFRRPSGEGKGSRDTQGAVLLLVIGTIVAIHGLGLMEYRPSNAELGL